MEKQTLNYVDTFNRIAIANYKKSVFDSDMEDERIRKELLPKREINYLDGIDVYLGGEKIAWESYNKRVAALWHEFSPMDNQRKFYMDIMNPHVRVCELCGNPCFDNGKLLSIHHLKVLSEAIKTAPKYLMCDTCNH